MASIDDRIRSWAPDHWETGAYLQARDTARAKGVSGVAIMPDAHRGSGACIGTVVATEGTIIPAAVGVDLGCFVGSTTVPLASGEEASLFDMAESGDTYWVYSVAEDGNVETAQARSRKTRHSSDLVEVVVSTIVGGERSVVCTPDHEFLVRGGSSAAAEDLTEGAELCGLYRTPGSVVSVRAIPDKEDVYCLTVPDYSNFALSAGVFVHNCGMSAIRTDMTSSQLPDNLDAVLSAFETAVPAKHHQNNRSKGARRKDALKWMRAEPAPSGRGNMDRAAAQMGTLGGGNHFLELSEDTSGRIWVVLHSGSRGIGHNLATQHIKIAKEIDRRGELSALTEGTSEFDEYIGDMLWAQKYAYVNREVMLHAAVGGFLKAVGRADVGRLSEVIEDEIRCHHNYAETEQHEGKDMWITRKGAIRTQVGDRGIIPGSMGTATYIVEGLGNPLSYNSSSHGAGRRMSRTEAKKRFSARDLSEDMAGRTWLADGAHKLVDEIPGAYKDIEDVMAAQTDLCKVSEKLEALVNYKGLI